MQKGTGPLVVAVAVLALLAVFLLFRGRPAGEETPPPPGAVAPTLTPSPLAASPAAAPTATVLIGATGFTPKTVTVGIGGLVTFTNVDQDPHQVASVPHPVHTTYPPLNGPVLSPDETFTVSFTGAGSFGYHDHLNPGVTGTVVVR